MLKKAASSVKRHRILLVDDHPIVREGLVARIDAQDDMIVCGEAENAEQALDAVQRCSPDLVITDLSLTGRPGLELIKDLDRRFPSLPTLVLSIHDENLWAERVLRAGAKGYVMKAQATEKVMDAIRRVLAGGVWLSDSISSSLLGKLTRGRQRTSDSPVSQLSDRELEIFHMIGRGLSPREIAAQLFVSVKTVDVHRDHMKEKLGLRSSADLLRYAVTFALQEGTGA